MRMTLKNYVDRIEKKYAGAREEWSKLQKALKDENERFGNIKWSNYSSQGKIVEEEKHQKILREIHEKLDRLRADFIEAVEEIETDSDKVFNRAFQYNPGDVDMNGVTILQNGSLKPHELIDLAETYRNQGNYTMYFLIAEKMNSNKDYQAMSDQEKKALAYYREAQHRRNSREDHDILEGFRDLCLFALRDEDYLSDGIHRDHDGYYQRYSDYADGIEIEAPSPWE